MRRIIAFTLIASSIAAVSGAPAGAVDSHKIGKKAPSGDLIFVVHGFTDPYVSPNQFSQAESGNRQVAIDLEVINKTKEQQNWSYVLLAHLITKDRKTYDPVFTIIDPPPPDGAVPAKFSVRGSVPFEIPVDAVMQYIRVQGNITANGALIKLKMPVAPPAAP